MNSAILSKARFEYS